jgi:hypothetical protein
MDVQAIVNDPEFQAKSPEVQQTILEKSDPDFAGKDPAVKSAILSKLRTSGGNLDNKIADPQAAPKIPTITPNDNESLLKRVAADFSSRQQNVKDIYGRSGESTGEKLFNAPGTAALASGQAAGFADDMIGEAIISAWNTLAPTEFKQLISEQIGDFAKTKLGQMGIDALSRGVKKYELFSKTYPDGAKALEGILNFSALGLTNAARKQASKAIADTSTVTAKALNRTINHPSVAVWEADKRLSNQIRDSIKQVIDLSGEGKGRFNQRMKYLDRSEGAIQDIVANRDNIRLVDTNGALVANKLPTNPDTALWDMTQAIEQTKQKIWPEVEGAMQSAEAIGLKISPNQVIDNIQKYISSPSIISRPDAKSIIKQGEDMIKYYSELGLMDIFETHNIIKDRGATLKKMGQYSSVSLSDTDRAGLFSAELAGLNGAFKKSIGPEASGALGRYGSLLEIENDFNKLIHTKIAGKGIDYATTFSSLEALKAATGHGFNPSALGTSHVIAAITKANRQSGKIIAKMFQKVDETMQRQVKANTPTSIKPIVGAAIAEPVIASGNDFQARLAAFKQSTKATDSQR